MCIRIVVVDDHPIVRSGLASLLHETEIEIVGEASGIGAARKLIRGLLPDLVLLDVRLEDGDCFELMEWLRGQNLPTPVLIFSAFDNPTYMARALAFGALGYLYKDCDRDELVQAIRGARAGKGIVGNRLPQLRREIMSPQLPSVDLPSALTQKEIQILRHLGLGLNNREIGLSLEISVNTVKEYVQKILRKLGLTDRTAAAVWACENGFVPSQSTDSRQGLPGGK